MGQANDLTGKRFGLLTAIAPTEERKNGYTVWRCRCDCGGEAFVPSRMGLPVLSTTVHSIRNTDWPPRSISRSIIW